MTFELAGLSNGRGNSSGNGNGGNGEGRKPKIKPRTIPTYKYTTKDYGLAEEVFLESEGKPKFLLLDPETKEPILEDSINLIEDMFAILKPQELVIKNKSSIMIVCTRPTI